MAEPTPPAPPTALAALSAEIGSRFDRLARRCDSVETDQDRLREALMRQGEHLATLEARLGRPDRRPGDQRPGAVRRPGA
ncbi:MAG: hypothetical protein WCO00_04430 [Rhodospirillaceae bacterium]